MRANIMAESIFVEKGLKKLSILLQENSSEPQFLPQTITEHKHNDRRYEFKKAGMGYSIVWVVFFEYARTK